MAYTRLHVYINSSSPVTHHYVATFGKETPVKDSGYKQHFNQNPTLDIRYTQSANLSLHHVMHSCTPLSMSGSMPYALTGLLHSTSHLAPPGSYNLTLLIIRKLFSNISTEVCHMQHCATGAVVDEAKWRIATGALSWSLDSVFKHRNA